MGGFSFSVDADGNPGYRKPGADTVTPFKKGGLQKTCLGECTLAISLAQKFSFSAKNIENWNSLTSDNFALIPRSAHFETGLDTVYNPSYSLLYNSSDGTLTVSSTLGGSYSGNSKRVYICFDVYCFH